MLSRDKARAVSGFAWYSGGVNTIKLTANYINSSNKNTYEKPLSRNDKQPDHSNIFMMLH